MRGQLAYPLALLAISGCIGPLRQVRVDRDPSVPMPPGATWMFRGHDEPMGPEADALLDNPIAHQRIERLIAGEMIAHGYRQVDDPMQATLIVDYHLGLRERQETHVEQHATQAWAPITTCQDHIEARGHEEGDRDRDHDRDHDRGQGRDRDKDRDDRPNARDTSRITYRDRDTARADRRNPRDNPRDDRDHGRDNDRGNDRDRDRDSRTTTTVRTCSTRLVWGPYGPPETSYKTFTYREGTIVVDLSDRATGLVAWRVVGVRRLNIADEREETLHEVVARLMRDLPRS